jgi:beta-lactamase regulating signal transducer with metallopeptidase domain
MADAAHWQVLAQIVAGKMLNGMVLGIIPALFGWLVVRALKRQNAGTRFALWFSTMVAVAAFPFFESSGVSTLANAVHPALRLPQSWAVAIVAIWALLAGVGLAKVGLGFWQLRQLMQDSTLIETFTLPSILRNTLNEYGSSRGVMVRSSDRVPTPTALGFIKPAIVLPPWALQELSPDELNAVFLHELAHLRRRDDWTNLAQEILKALFFFHPAIWWIGRSLSMEREMACDDFVLAGTSNPRGYAKCLVSVAEKSFVRRGLALAQAVAGRMQQTTRRVMLILDANRPVATKVSMPALGMIALVSVVCLVALPYAPRLVAFDEPQPDASASVPAAATPLADPAVKMIPAAFHGEPLNSSRIPAAAIHTRAVSSRSRNIPNHSAMPIGTDRKIAARQNNSPHIINATSVDEASYPNAMLLVIQTEQIDSYGRVWSISVMRLTVFHPPDFQELDRQDNGRHVLDLQMQKGIVPKTT